MTVDFVGRGCSVLILICRELMDSTTEVSLEKQFEAASHSGLVWSIILGWPQGILLLLSDFIVAWRAWAIWPTRRYVEVMLVTVLVGSCVFRICDEVLYTLDIYFPGHNSTRSTLGVFNMLSLGFSIFTNIVSTFLLALKTWIYVTTKRQLAVRYAKPTHSYQTLLLWVESGVLFGLFQMIFGVFQVLVSMTIINPKFIHPADAFLQALMKVVAALYPIAVFLMMKLRLSIVEECIMVQVQTSNNTEQ
ncbi:MAG: hypothetical protein NXY57DRAFT_1038647 [Lentinula lateritia]|uniref:Uncharacterized protein n=1 Tax=Lentinula lateritia TaxID=40482 RepID=A0ABQ8VQV7_9AGAR|nr:MAG: hypothetical protein NXY57DRAFT_1038647 [Lentinula lateritia]KAJ4498778.1 hypothetical protein C8R41DRAFT_864629 [Lentinula lateritia]